MQRDRECLRFGWSSGGVVVIIRITVGKRMVAYKSVRRFPGMEKTVKRVPLKKALGEIVKNLESAQGWKQRGAELLPARAKALYQEFIMLTSTRMDIMEAQSSLIDVDDGLLYAKGTTAPSLKSTTLVDSRAVKGLNIAETEQAEAEREKAEKEKREEKKRKKEERREKQVLADDGDEVDEGLLDVFIKSHQERQKKKAARRA